MQEQQMQQEQPQDVNPQMEGQPQEQVQQPQQTQFANGGLMDYISKNNSTNQLAEGGFANSTIGQGFGEDATADQQGAALAGGIGVLTTGLELGTQAFGKANVDMSGNGGEEKQSGAMSAVGGAAKGATAGMALGPVGAAVGGVLGLGAGILGANKHNKAVVKASNNKTQRDRNQALNTFAEGGQLNPDPTYPQDPNELIKSFKTNQEGLNYKNPYPNRSDRFHKFDDYQKRLKNRSFGVSSITPNYGSKLPFGDGNGGASPIKDEIKFNKALLTRSVVTNTKEDYNNQINNDVNNSFADGGQMTNQYALGDWLKTAGKNIGSTSKNIGKDIGTAASKTGKFLNENKGDILRYAPTAVNAFQLATLPKAEVESLNKLDNRYKPGYVDEAALQNTARENYNMTSQALSGASGGSTSALRSNILGAGLNRNKALSNAYLKSSDINRGEDAKAQQFNLGVDKVNLQQSNSEKDINARNRAARDNEKSKLLSGIGTDIGNIGKEEKYKDIILKASGYDQDGKLAAAKKAKKEAAKRDRILKRKTNKIKKTAKKSSNKGNMNAFENIPFKLYNGLKTYNV